MRIWLMKMTQQLCLEARGEMILRPELMSRACAPICKAAGPQSHSSGTACVTGAVQTSTRPVVWVPL